MHILTHTPAHNDTPTQMYMHKEPLFQGNSASVWPAVAMPPVPAAFPRLVMLLHPLPPPENRRKRSWELQLPSTSSSHYLRKRPGAQPPGTCSPIQKPHFRLSPASATDSVSQHTTKPEDLGQEDIPPPLRARKRSTPVCRRLEEGGGPVEAKT